MLSKSRSPAIVRVIVGMAMRQTYCVVRVNVPIEETLVE